MIQRIPCEVNGSGRRRQKHHLGRMKGTRSGKIGPDSSRVRCSSGLFAAQTVRSRKLPGRATSLECQRHQEPRLLITSNGFNALVSNPRTAHIQKCEIDKKRVMTAQCSSTCLFKKAIMGHSVVDIDTPGRIQGDGGIRDFSTVRFRSRATGVQFREVTRGAELVSE